LNHESICGTPNSLVKGVNAELSPSGAKDRVDFKATYGTTKVVPFQNSPLMGVFPQPVKSCPFKT
jgi:hypothetical protein